MRLNNVIRKLASGDVHYALGRFDLVRQSYGYLERRRRPQRHYDCGTSLWPNADPAEMARILARDSYVSGYDLSDELVVQLRDFAWTTSWMRPGFCDQFRLEDVTSGLLPNGEVVALAHSVNAMSSPSVRRIFTDAGLNAMVSEYFGYCPRQAKAILFYSPVIDLSDTKRRALNQTIDYHYDVDAFNFAYAHFYLSDVDEHSGPHVLVAGSHRKKPLRMLIGSARADVSSVHATFGSNSRRVITGPSGTGFVEDTSCYHLASPPTKRDRLMLQLRFR